MILVFRSFYFAPGRLAKFCDQRVCLSVCPLACISETTRPNFLHILPVAVARSSSDGNATCCVLPVSWMTSCFHTVERMGQNQRRRVCFVKFGGGGRRYDCWFVYYLGIYFRLCYRHATGTHDSTTVASCCIFLRSLQKALSIGLGL